MTDKSAIFEKAAEIIVRDGQAKNSFFGGQNGPILSKEEMLEHAAGDSTVCAIGACLRAEYELTGDVQEFDNAYEEYSFRVVMPNGRYPSVWVYNDRDSVTAEDIALLLKRRAAGETVENPLWGDRQPAVRL